MSLTSIIPVVVRRAVGIATEALVWPWLGRWLLAVGEGMLGPSKDLLWRLEGRDAGVPVEWEKPKRFGVMVCTGVWFS